jgi:metal-responsive CopG/Arc/MetJ family transcriptional regulator
MTAVKIAITIDQELVAEIDRLVEKNYFPSRSRAVQEAVRDKLERLNKSRLARECAKLNPASEQMLAEEALEEDFAEWPAY